MHLYNRTALAIMQEARNRLDKLDRDLPTILQAEQIAEAFTAAGIKTAALYGMNTGVHLKTTVPIDQLPHANKTLHAQAAKCGRIVLTATDTRFVLAPIHGSCIDNPVIEMTIEEI